MNRFIASAAILLALGTAVAGCGGNSGSRHGAQEYPVYGPGSTGNIAKGGTVQGGGGNNGGGGGTVGTFSAGPALNQARYDHTATTLSDGRVLVTGGGISAGGGSVLTSSEIFDPVANSWTDITAAPGGKMTVGTFDSARQGHTAVLLQTGTVIVAGGTGAERLDTSGQPVPEQLKSAFSFNPANNTFTAVGDLLQNRGYHLGAVLPNGRALVASGINQSQTASIAGAESFDPNANAWTNVAMGAHHTYGVAFTTINNPTTVVGFGFELGMVPNPQTGQQQFGFKAPPSVRTEKFDSTGTAFVAGPTTASDRIFACANRISSSNALIVGGIGAGNALLNTTETFDPAANAFAAGPNLTNARQSAEMTEIGTSSDQLIVAGIDGQGAVMANCEVYGAQNKVIVGTVDMQNARFLHKVAGIAGGRTLVIGGSTDAGQPTETDSVEIHTR